MAVNHILTQGSGCSSWELKPRRNLPAQLPFSDYSERCSGHFSKKLRTKRRLPESAARQTAMKNHRGLKVKCRTVDLLKRSCYTHSESIYHKLKAKVSRLWRQFGQWNRRSWTGTCCEDVPDAKFVAFISSDLGSLSISLSLNGLKHHHWSWATCVLPIWMAEKHMFTSAVSSQDQLSSVTNIC